MKEFKHTLRVRYADTDQMGFVYYGKYAEYFEVARVEALRTAGFSYKKMEEDGFLLPVIEYQIKYFKPALYDAEITIVSSAQAISTSRIAFHHQCFVKGQQINEAKVILACVQAQNKKPVAIPADIASVFAAPA